MGAAVASKICTPLVLSTVVASKISNPSGALVGDIDWVQIQHRVGWETQPAPGDTGRHIDVEIADRSVEDQDTGQGIGVTRNIGKDYDERDASGFSEGRSSIHQ